MEVNQPEGEWKVANGQYDYAVHPLQKCLCGFPWVKVKCMPQTWQTHTTYSQNTSRAAGLKIRWSHTYTLSQITELTM